MEARLVFTVTPDDITALFPEFAGVDETTAEFYIDLARDHVNESRWGTEKARRGVILLAAHFMERAGLLDDDDTAGGSRGAVLSETTGSISTTYAAPLGSLDGTTLSLTSYGEQFAMLKRTVVKTPLVT